MKANIISCTGCGANLRLKNPPTPGKKIICPKCKQSFTIHETEEIEEEFEEIENLLPKCRSCGHRCSSNAKVCPKCGEDWPTASLRILGTCRGCGSKVSKLVKACPKCGEDHPTKNKFFLVLFYLFLIFSIFIIVINLAMFFKSWKTQGESYDIKGSIFTK